MAHHDCRRKLLGKEPCAGRAGCPSKQGDAVRGAPCGNPAGAGPFWPIAASLLGHYAMAWLPPRSLHSAKIGSVVVSQIGRKVL
ncbi:MAG: hypothetical protein B7Y31_07495 [Novosphingobium sp. 16-62-11]|nr:MAG: hypothetical protein B7Y31_07495 [Novosphingobium sp. 16-62-11]OZA20592.1 MAG: hypothetical protein B7X90_05630 [Novosphingobium sp. 17-62-19]